MELAPLQLTNCGRGSGDEGMRGSSWGWLGSGQYGALGVERPFVKRHKSLYASTCSGLFGGQRRRDGSVSWETLQDTDAVPQPRMAEICSAHRRYVLGWCDTSVSGQT
jgi:hypothetical protein